jgi:AraC family transcriptional regulator, positive regulator of tynA and feaB
MRIKETVERNVHDPDLTPATIAAELKLSARNAKCATTW